MPPAYVVNVFTLLTLMNIDLYNTCVHFDGCFSQYFTVYQEVIVNGFVCFFIQLHLKP